MIYNNLCGEKISRLGFGCMRFPKSIEETQKCIDEAIRQGINYFDTAYVYNNSERTLASCLKKYNRDQYYITSKLPIDYIKDQSDVRKIFNESCERLSTDYIDFYLLHAMNLDKLNVCKKYNVLKELDDLKKEGRIKHLGFSIHATSAALKEILKAYNFEFAQIQLNYLDMVHEPGFEGYEILTENNIPVIIMEPVKGGLLANIPAPLNQPFIDYDSSRSNASYCFSFLKQFPNIKVILSGMSNYEQVIDNLKTFEKEEPYTKEMDEAINKVKENIKGINKVNCTGCSYCVPCPFGVEIPKCFRIYNMHALGETLKNDWYLGAKYPTNDASLCKNCKACLKKCPQGINIPEVLKDTLKDKNK